MRVGFFLFLVNLNRVFFSWRFWISVCGVAFVLGISSFGDISANSDVLSIVRMSGTGNFILTVALLPLIPFATSFAAEWQERAAAFWMVRTGVRAYATSKVIVSAITGALVTFLGIFLYALILSIWLPFYTSYITGDAYETLLLEGMPMSYLFFSAAHLSLTAALFAVAALWISTYLPNTFSALATPIVLYFVLFRLTRFWELPPYLQLNTLIEGIYDAGSPLNTFFFKLVIVLFLIGIMGYGTLAKMRRRVQSD